MPKLKPHKTAVKRFKFTSTGKISRRQANLSHNLTNRAPGRKRQLQKSVQVSAADNKRVRRMVGI